MGKTRTLASTVSTGGSLSDGTASARGAVITLSGSSAAFDVPTWAKRITLLFRNMSASGLSTGAVQVQVATAGQGYLTSGYNGVLHTFNSTSVSSTGMSICFLVNETNSDAYEYTGVMELYEIEPNVWVERGHTKVTTSRSHASIGDIALSERMTSIRFFIGVGTFDGGKVNVMFS